MEKVEIALIYFYLGLYTHYQMTLLQTVAFTYAIIASIFSY